MNILYLRNTRGYHVDVIEALEDRGHRLKILAIPDANDALLKEMADNPEHTLLAECGNGGWDICFTLDYYPCIGELCRLLNQKYVSWSLEPPFSNLYSASIVYPNNLVFVADKWAAERLNREGIPHVFYLPEGVNIKRAKRVREAVKTGTQRMQEAAKPADKLMACSLIGDLRNNSWQALFGTEHLRDSTLGYLEGMIAGQNLVYGFDFFERNLPEYVMRDLLENAQLVKPSDNVESAMQYFAEQCFYPKTTATDRNVAAKCLAAGMSISGNTVHLFGDNPEAAYEGTKNHGLTAYEQRLEIIRDSIINVSIAPRGFKDGIYGHVLQILGMEGFLITDYRAALTEAFVPGEDFIIYDDMKHLVSCADKYLEQEAERQRIARNGYEKIMQSHRLEQRIEEIEHYL